MPIDALILSAGEASRFGLPKFLLPAGRGRTLLTLALEKALQSVDGGVVVVIGRDAGLARAAARDGLGPEDVPRVRLVENPEFVQGLSTSVKAGVAALGAQSALVLLADQPAISLAQLQQLADHFAPPLWAVSASEGGEPKPPMILGSELLEQVQTLSGDQGFKPLLRKNLERVRLLEWGPGPWATDVDTWEVYRRLALELGWQKEPFEPLDGPPTPDQLGRWLEAQKLDPQAYLSLLQRAVLTLLNL
ncbi:MAG: nucleotidyltransferase family protein [Meiothermus sp.]|nr:nucleotidyltransferase family protein [Meiothermus sp.]